MKSATPLFAHPDGLWCPPHPGIPTHACVGPPGRLWFARPLAAAAAGECGAKDPGSCVKGRGRLGWGAQGLAVRGEPSERGEPLESQGHPRSVPQQERVATFWQPSTHCVAAAALFALPLLPRGSPLAATALLRP